MHRDFTDATSVADVLNAAFKRRYEKNPLYSLRAFARDLAISRSYLSDILKSRCGLSKASALTIAKSLDYGENEADYLFALSDQKFARTTAKREMAEAKIRALAHASSREHIQLDTFESVSEWYHLAILELTLLEQFEFSDEYIASALDIPRETVRPAIDRLVRLGLARIESGRLIATEAMGAGNEVPSKAIRNFHRQVLKKADASIEGQSPDRRLLTSGFIALPEDRLAAARKRIQDFMTSFTEEFDSTESKDALFAVSLQFFDLLPTEKVHQ